MAAIGALVGAAVGCVNLGAFACATDQDCDLGGKSGICQASGYCSYPDDGCASGQRYDKDAGGGLGGQCVGEDDETTNGPDSTTTNSGSGPSSSSDPTDSSTSTTVGEEETAETGPGCGAGGEPCCGGGTCDDGLQCFGGQCGCVTALGAGAQHTCAIKVDGTAWCWGANESGQVGIGSTEDQLEPVKVPAAFGDGVNAIAISAVNHTCVEREDGVAFCWGSNGSGQVTTVEGADEPSPIQASWAEPMAGIAVGSSHTCALPTGDVDTRCWGSNSNGQLTTGNPGPGPIDQTVAFDPAEVVAGQAHTCVRTTPDGTVECWGHNGFGQLATDPGVTPFTTGPIPIPVGPNVSQLTTGRDHVCALLDGDVLCWGRNDQGQLGWGMGLSPYQLTPVFVAFPILAGAATRIEAGWFHTCAITEDSVLYCWGSNDRDQILLEPDKMGEDGYTDAPALIDGLGAVIDVAAGRTHTCALTSQGEPLCWGTNTRGQLGNGTTDHGFQPTTVAITCP